MNTNPRTARLIAWAAFALGVAASVAANVAHARPELGPRLASGFAPVALFLTVEIMSRVPWPAGTWWSLGRFAGAGTVALVAAITCYSHMYGLLRTYGESPVIAAIQPACIDGLMVVASLALVALGTTAQATTTAAPAKASTQAAATQTATPAPAPDSAPARSVMPIPAEAFARPNGHATRGGVQ